MRWLETGLIILFAGGILICGLLLGRKAAYDYVGEASYEELRVLAGMQKPMSRLAEGSGKGGEYGNMFPKIQEEILTSINPDYAAWLVIPGTVINYPVVRSTTNQEWLSRSFTGKENACGTLFFDCATEPLTALNTTIHGHNMKSGAMFGGLKSYLEEDWEEHDALFLYYKEEWRQYRVFAVYETTIADSFPYQYLFTSDAAWQEFVADCQKRSLVSAAAGGEVREILTLSTCHGSKRKLIIQAILNVERGDKSSK